MSDSATALRVLKDEIELAAVAAEMVAAAAERAVAERGVFRVALSGGTAPLRLYRTLAEPPFASRIDWSRVRVFQCDERTVPPDHPDSNYGRLRATLLSRVRIPAGAAHRMRGEDPPEAAASAYEREIARDFGLSESEVRESPPSLDLVLLGMGEDGHTASLFPGGRALLERRALVVADHVARLDAWRITMTLPLLDAAREAIFLAPGSAKRDRVAEIHGTSRPPEGREPYPCERVRPRGPVTWLLDEASAAGLPASRP